MFIETQLKNNNFEDNTEISFKKITKNCFIREDDCINTMQYIKNHTIDLILTDPPYNLGEFMQKRNVGISRYRDNHFAYSTWDDLDYDSWLECMNNFFTESSRILKKRGAMLLFMSLIKIETIIAIAQKHGFYYKTTGIWHKTNPMPRNKNIHFINSTEAWVYFINKGTSGTFNNSDKVIHDYYESSVTPLSEKKFGKHPTQKPLSITKWFVKILTNNNEVVLDPFMGSGTVGVACEKTNRYYYGIELNKDYFEIAKKRIKSEMTKKSIKIVENDIKKKQITNPNYKIIDIFSGVGGLSYGFHLSGFNTIAAVENDNKIAEGFRLNNKNVELIIEDVRCLNIKKTFKKYADKIDVIIGGPPCQGFSQKGKRLTLKDERNYLFKYFINVVDYLKPEFFLIENVPNILTTQKGFFKSQIKEQFIKIGYEVKNKTLNAIEYGVPQNRMRAFFVGRYKRNNFIFPKPKNKLISIKDAIYDLPFLNSGEGLNFTPYQKTSNNYYQKTMRKNSKGIYNHIATNHSKLVLKRLALIPKGKGKETLPNKHLTKSIYSGTWCRMIEDRPSVTITTRFDTPSSGRFTHPILDRCITVREAARLQSFPDSFIFCGNKSVQMRQVGNAVPPLLAKAIADKIKNALK